MEAKTETAAMPKMPAPPRGPVILRPLEYVFGPWTRENAMVWLKLIALVLVLKWLLIEPFRVPSGSMEPTFYGNMRYSTDDRVAVNKLAYGVRLPLTSCVVIPASEPKRWDIVVFRSVEPPMNAGPLGQLAHRVWPYSLVKRVVGLPGERVHIENGRVYVNNKPLELPPGMPDVHYTSLAPNDPLMYSIESDPSGAFKTVARGTRMRYGIWTEDEYSVVPPGHYLVLGDNSDNSVDGRYFGWVPRGQILGRAFAIWWPLNRVRDLTGFTNTWWGLLLLLGIPLAAVAYEILVAFFTRSWRVREDVPSYGLRRGDRLRINCLVYGLRLPFSRKRLTTGFGPRPGDLAVYLAPRGSEWAGVPLLGRVSAREEGPGCYIESAEGDEYPDSRHFGPIARANLVGRAESVWWPLGRRRPIEAPADPELALKGE